MSPSPASNGAGEAPLTVTELTARIRQALERGFARVTVIGEVSRLTAPPSGHLYFTIKDAGAAISAVIWRSTLARLPVRPEDGGEFVFAGHLSVYEPRGIYQLIVNRVEPAGAGRLAAEFERRKQRFAERGWFDAARKRKPPRLPTHIGIATSPNAAALEDVKKVLATRPGWLRLTLAPCLVQGAQAPASIARALERLAALPSRPDVILLVRGGGSIEDLWCFNDERVVRAIVDCPVPVIAGIGHEIDTTLADLAADVRAATPSNAAELACPSRDELRKALPDAGRLVELLAMRIRHLRQRLHLPQSRLEAAVMRGMDRRLYASSQAMQRLHLAASGRMKRSRERLRAIERRMAPLEPGARLRRRRQVWQQWHGRLQMALPGRLMQREQAVVRALHHLEAAIAARSSHHRHA
ncbi:MAG: exodeoxyribonuclease VII large subunit, partial [Mariprofundaceae bacterium]